MRDATFTAPDLTTFTRLNALGLQAVGQCLQPHRAVLACTVIAEDRWCRRCGCEGRVRDSVMRELAHAPLGWRPTTLQVRLRRYRCTGCGHVWRQGLSDAAAPRAKLTKTALAWALEGLVVAHLSMTRIAEALGVAWDTANTAVLAEGRRVLISDDARFEGVRVLGVDEHVWRHTRRGDKYVTVIIDLTPVRDGTGSARLLDMVEGRSKNAFKTWLKNRDEAWRKRIEVVAMDGFTGFKTAAVEEIPHVTAVMDPFHVVHLAADALDECRRRTQQDIFGRRGRAADPLYKARRTLHTGVDLLTDKQKTRLANLFADEQHLAVEGGTALADAIVGLSEKERQFTSTFAAATVGYAVPAAVAAAVARPGSPAVAIVDRRGWTEGHTEVLSARKHALPVSVVLLATDEREASEMALEARALGLNLVDAATACELGIADAALILTPGPVGAAASTPQDVETTSETSFVEGRAMGAVARAKLTGVPARVDAEDEQTLLRMLNALYDASFDNVPVVLTTREEGWTRPGDVLLPDVAIATYLGLPEDEERLVQRARVAARHARGVAHVRLLPARTTTSGLAVPTSWCTSVQRPQPRADDVGAAARLLERAASAVILCGGGAADTQDLLQELAARLSAPVVATMGGGFADHIESFGGYVGSSGHKGANSALREADVVLALGVSNRGAAFDLFGAGRQVIDVNIDIEVLSHRRASLAVHATCEDFLTDLLHRVQTDRGSHHPLAATHATWWESAATRSTLRGALRPSYVVRELSKASEEHEDVGFAGDVGINTLWLMRYHRGHGQTLWTRNFATMGFALPAAVERARETGKPSIAITGDGGMAMAMAGLRPAPAADVPVLCAVLDNSGLADIRYEQEILGWPEFESGFSNPDFGAVGRSHGWRGTTVRTAGDLHAAVEAFFSQPTPTVLNIVCSKDEPPMPAMSPRPTQVAAASVAWVRQGRKGLRSAGHALKGLTER